MAANLTPELFEARVAAAPVTRARLNGQPTKDLDEWLMSAELERTIAVDEQFPALAETLPE